MMFSGGFSIGRVFGIDIRIDWSWLFIFVLVTWNLADVFGQVHTNWGAVLTWGTSVVAALLFFASVLAHELAHSLVARAQGVPVRSITLFLFGGVSSIERDPSSARNEFLMAFVGPLTSIVIGIVLLLIAGAGTGSISASVTDPTQAIALLNPLTTLLMWLGSVNVFVGFFNLIPGFPLDGGRVVRAILWALTDDLRSSTRWASVLGQLIAWLMILAGIAMVFGVQIPFFGTGLGGLWLAFIGWFLNTASAQSYRQLVIHDILEGVGVSRMMRSEPPTVAPNVSVSSLVHDYIMGHEDRAFPVMEDGRLVGLVTLEDVRHASRETWETATVREIMTPADELVEVRPEEDAAEALNKLTARNVGQLPVTQDDKLVGLLRRQDLVNWLQLHSELNLGRRS
jgi:Zn-dependent protease/predicted transcriptional regulator